MLHRQLTFYLLLALITGLGLSCKQENFRCIRGKGEDSSRKINLSDFSEVHLQIGVDVSIAQDTQFYIEAIGPENILNELDVWVNSDALIIDSDRCINDGKEVKIEIRMPSLNYLGLFSSGNIETSSNFESVAFDFDLAGSGNLSHFTTTDVLSGTLSGSGNAYIGGSATTQEIEIEGSGSFFGFNQIGHTALLRIDGSGNAEVRVSDSLDVELNASGSVYYKGNPSIVQRGSGSGQVIDAN